MAALEAAAADPGPDDWPMPSQEGGTLDVAGQRRLAERLGVLKQRKARLGEELDRIITARLRGEPEPVV